MKDLSFIDISDWVFPTLLKEKDPGSNHLLMKIKNIKVLTDQTVHLHQPMHRPSVTIRFDHPRKLATTYDRWSKKHGNGMEWNGMEWNGMEWNGMEWNGMEWNGMEWNGMEWNGMEWNGMEWNGMEWTDLGG